MKATCIVALVGTFILTACSPKPPIDSKIIGKWELVTEGTVHVTNEFKADETWASQVGTSRHATGTWSLSGESLTMTPKSATPSDGPSDPVTARFRLTPDGQEAVIDDPKHKSKP